MPPYRRYALYYTPPPGKFADFGASWLGWDAVRGEAVAQPEMAGLDLPAVTAEPRKYGFHATLKAPFRLAEGQGEDELACAVARVAADLRPVILEGLGLTRIGPFLALTPQGDQTALNALAGQVVQVLDPFRAPLTEAELARRNPARLTPRQRELLDLWGYPYVFDEFQFHMTLTGALDPVLLDRASAALRPYQDLVPRPFTLDALSLMGETQDGRVRLIRRVPL